MALPTDPADIDAAFRKYEVQVRAYGISWWTSDPHAEEVFAHDSELLDRLATRALDGESIETKDVHYMEEPEDWRLARKTLHSEVIEDLFGEHPAAVAKPIAIFLLGLPGSGKSTVLKRIAEGYLARQGGRSAVTRDADEVRIRLPEYGDGRGSQIVQEEVVDMTYGHATSALPPNGHLLIDVVGDPEWLPREVRHFSEQGRHIVMLCSDVSTDVAIQRAKVRALQSGRYVSIAYLRSCAGRPRAALERAIETSLVQHWAVIDTGGSTPAVKAGDGHFGAPGETVRYWSRDPD